MREKLDQYYSRHGDDSGRGGNPIGSLFWIVIFCILVYAMYSAM